MGEWKRRSMWWGSLAGMFLLTGAQLISNRILWEASYYSTKFCTGTVYDMMWFGVLNPIMQGGLLGALSALFVVSYLERDTESVCRYARLAQWAALCVIIWTTAAIAAFFNEYAPKSAVGWNVGLEIPGPNFIPWPVRWTFILLFCAFGLQWALALAIAGTIAANRLAHDQEQGQRIAAPVERLAAN